MTYTLPPGVKAPTDHQAPAAQAGPVPFAFLANDGQTLTLPPPTDALAVIPGRALRDAIVGGDEGELRLAFIALEACDVPPDTLDALYDLPAVDMLNVVGRWLRSLDTSGGSLPEA